MLNALLILVDILTTAALLIKSVVEVLSENPEQ
jgi:hypothetical protein